MHIFYGKCAWIFSVLRVCYGKNDVFVSHNAYIYCKTYEKCDIIQKNDPIFQYDYGKCAHILRKMCMEKRRIYIKFKQILCWNG